MTVRALASAALSVGLVGCFGSIETGTPSAPKREPVATVERPQTVGLTPFDYASLPVLTYDASSAPQAPTRLRAAVLDGSASFAAEVRAGEQSYFTWARAAGERPMAWATCVPGTGGSRSPARADVLWLATRSPSGMLVTTATGLLDYGGCVFEGRRESTVTAAAVVPDAVYAARQCTAGCELPLGNALRSEQIVIYAPSSSWITTNHAVSDEIVRPRTGPFSRVMLPVGRGTSTTAAITVVPEALAAFRGEKPGAATTTSLANQYTVELVWAANDEVPLATSYVATVARPDASIEAGISGPPPG